VKTRDWRKEHEIACQALEIAKERAEDSYQLPKMGILFKKIQRNGAVRVGYKDFSSESHFKLVPMHQVQSMGVDIDSLPEYTEFSKEFYRLQYAAQRFFSDARYKSKQAINSARGAALKRFYDERREIYDAYLSSPEWAAKRQQCYQAHGTTCVDCEKSHATDIHHKHYETLGDEDPKSDIVPLCSECHKARHESGNLAAPARKSAQITSVITAGSMVAHPKFGEGIVVAMEGKGSMARVMVDFRGAHKWLVMAYAPLRLVL